MVERSRLSALFIKRRFFKALSGLTCPCTLAYRQLDWGLSSVRQVSVRFLHPGKDGRCFGPGSCHYWRWLFVASCCAFCCDICEIIADDAKVTCFDFIIFLHKSLDTVKTDLSRGFVRSSDQPVFRCIYRCIIMECFRGCVPELGTIATLGRLARKLSHG